MGFITSCLSSGGTVVELSHIVLESGRVGKKVSGDLRVESRAHDDSAYARSTGRVQQGKRGNTKFEKDDLGVGL